MVRRVAGPGFGLLVLAALSSPAVAEQSTIAFVSGPLAGAMAQNVERKEDNNLAEGGTMVSESAIFTSHGVTAYIQWTRLGGQYAWQDGGLDELTRDVQNALKASGAAVTGSGRINVDGFLTTYRNVDYAGTPHRCGVFSLFGVQSRIIGFACRQDGGTVAVPPILEGLAIDGLIGP